jgi:O-antigen/teichoic acid export membrane protein
MTLTDRIVRGVTASLGARLVGTLGNAALLVLLTRYFLDPAAYGRVYFALSVVGVAAMLGMLGLPKSAGRYVTEFTATEPGQVPHVVRIAVFALGVTATVVALGFTVLSGVLASLLGDPALVPFLALGGVYVVVRAYHRLFSNLFQGFNRIDYSALVGAVNAVSRLTAVLALVAVGLGALGAFAGYIVGHAAAVAVGAVVLYRRCYTGLPTGVERVGGLVRRILEYSVPTAATRASVVVDNKVDKVIVGTLVGPAAVGFYTLAGQVADFCVVPAQSLGFTISPAIGEQSHGDQTDRAARLYEQSMSIVLLLYLPAAVGLVLVARPTVGTVFGTDYLPAVSVLQVFALFVVVRAVHKITGNGLDFLGLARIRAIARGSSAIGNVVLTFALVPPFGILGAAVATVVTYSAYTAVNVVYIHRALDVRTTFLRKRAVQSVAVAAVVGAVVAPATTYVTGLLTLAGIVLLGVAVWAVVIVASGLVDPKTVRSLLA